ncbi:UNVERIFIED_CONTAM: effector binding domain-containing protein [Halobacillus marinus]
MTLKYIKEESRTLIGFHILCSEAAYGKEIASASRVLSKEFPASTCQIGAFIPGPCEKDEDGYWLGVPLEEAGEKRAGMSVLTIPAQTYAVMTHTGSGVDIRRTYETLHSIMDVNGCERIFTSFCMEVYRRWGNQEELVVDLYEPVATEGGYHT